SPEGTFFLSSRAPLIEKLSSWNTIKDRGLINERDTPLVPERLRSKYRRFHYIASEANARSDLTALKVGSMILMITMLEAGWSLDHLRLKDPVNALAQCNSNPYGFLELDNGSSHSPLKIQWLLLQEACRFVEKVGHDLPEWVFWVLDRWELCLCSLEKKSILDVKENWIEWRAKQYLLQTTARDLKPIEQVYATEFIGLGEEVERAKKLEATRMLAPHCIADRDAPPDSVRAQERGKIVREILEKGEENRKVDWVKETNQNKGTDLSFPEPELACL
ncbi:MAG: uncharacterized protein K0S20_613, partial [Patescibacteria group bacterium]|nr:uncharacterized protein [Patescibacteria group bacterium]